MPLVGGRSEGAALNLSPFLSFLADKLFCSSLGIAEWAVFPSANSTKMCFQPSHGRPARLCSRPFPAEPHHLGRLGLTSARKADHLLGFSVCSWEGGWQSKSQSRLRFQLLLRQGRPLPCVWETARRWPASDDGLRVAWGMGYMGTWELLRALGRRGWQGRLHPRPGGCSWLQGRN